MTKLGEASAQTKTALTNGVERRCIWGGRANTTVREQINGSSGLWRGDIFRSSPPLSAMLMRRALQLAAQTALRWTSIAFRRRPATRIPYFFRTFAGFGQRLIMTH
jgi:hypothetical protein